MTNWSSDALRLIDTRTRTKPGKVCKRFLGLFGLRDYDLEWLGALLFLSLAARLQGERRELRIGLVLASWSLGLGLPTSLYCFGLNPKPY